MFRKGKFKYSLISASAIYIVIYFYAVTLNIMTVFFVVPEKD